MKPWVIMPVWSNDSETIDITENAVTSLKGFPLLIVDNGSTVGSGQLRSWADLYVRNKENLGYAKAVNQGLKLTKGIVVIANNDIRVSPNWWEVAEPLINRERVVTVHFRMIPYNEEFSYGELDAFKGRERWCTGSFFVLRSHSLLDENYLNSYEDWDLQYRARNNGYITVYTNRACYQHMDSYTQMKVMDDKREERNRKNREYFKQKYGEYPEDIWNTLYPDQMAQAWKPFP